MDLMMKYLGIPGAAQVLDKSPGAVRQMVWRRQIPYRKVGGRIVFLRSEIEKMIEDAPGVRLDEVQKRGA